MRRLAPSIMVLALGVPSVAAAQDDEQLVLLREPTTYTDVIDAADEDDPFDLNVTVGFVRSLTTGTIQREGREADGRTSANFIDIANHERLTNTLVLGLEAGVYQDLAVFARMPIVLSDERTLRHPDNRTNSEVEDDITVQDPQGDGMPPAPTPLFSMPFTSPTRSGIDYLALGAAWSIFNQQRDPEYPTWVVMIETRLPLGDPRHPCFENEPEDGSDQCQGGDTPGVNDGATWVRFETRMSRRYRYLEPYAGLSFQAGFPTSGDDLFSPGGDLAGFMNTAPPREGEFTAGVALVPWEHRARHQRFSIDLRLAAAYVSEGHYYSPLFDALGTSSSRYLREPNRECPDEATCPREVDFSGLTDLQAHGRVTGKLTVEMQAARYVKFAFGGSLAYATPYMITYSDACNPNLDPDSDDPRIGSCRQGIINPHHRPAIDLPGNRFRVENEITFDLNVSAVAQF